MTGFYQSTDEVIGQTPMVALDGITAGLDGRIFAKLEYLNPGFSKKDRIAKQIIEDAERSGELKPGQTVIELTSGNTGTGLAIVCGSKGYPFIAVMSRGNSIERARMMQCLGAEVVLVEQSPGSIPGQVSGEDLALVDRETQRLTMERGAFRADQFTLSGNSRAHYLHTGPEIIHQTAGNFQAFCDFPGTGGTFAGCTKAFKEYDPNINCYLVEPEGAPVLAGKEISDANHRIQGGGYCMSDLPLLDKDLVDGYIQISDKQAIEYARLLAKKAGIFAGFSSGANLAAAIQLINKVEIGNSVVIIICDSGLKYLSTDLWD